MFLRITGKRRKSYTRRSTVVSPIPRRFFHNAYRPILYREGGVVDLTSAVRVCLYWLVSRIPRGPVAGSPASDPCTPRRRRASSLAPQSRTPSRNTPLCRRNTGGPGAASTPRRPDTPPSACTRTCGPYTSGKVWATTTTVGRKKNEIHDGKEVREGDESWRAAGRGTRERISYARKRADRSQSTNFNVSDKSPNIDHGLLISIWCRNSWDFTKYYDILYVLRHHRKTRV